MPGVDGNIPIWLLGSSLFSAQLAAARSAYAFASHFAPRYMHQAIKLYRENFKPSAVLDKPYVMLGVPLIAADSDEAGRVPGDQRLPAHSLADPRPESGPAPACAEHAGPVAAA